MAMPFLRKTVAALAMGCVLLGCADGDRPLPSKLDAQGLDGGTPSPGRCLTPGEGCECENDGEATECATTARREDRKIWCSAGKRTCDNGRWGACVGERLVQHDLQSLTRSRGLMSVPAAIACDENPCDPYCKKIEDDPSLVELLDAGPLVRTEDGLELKRVPAKEVDQIACESIEVVPSPQEFVVTGIKGVAGSSGVSLAPIGPALLGEYFNQRSTSIPAAWTATATRADTTINFDWGNGSPGLTGISDNNFSVRWTGYITPPETGTFKLYTSTDDGVRLWLNDSLLIDAWRDQGTTEYASSNLTLTKGQYYPFKLEYYENGGGAVARLRWEGPGTGGKVAVAAQYYQAPPPPLTGLTGAYFNQIDATGIPAYWTPDALRADSNIAFNWGSSNPGITGLGTDNFSVRWTGHIVPPQSGNYEFYTYADDGTRLWVDGVQLIDDWSDHAPVERAGSRSVSMVAGQAYAFKLEYYEKVGGASAELRWQGPGTGGKTAIPSDRFQVPEDDGPLVVSPAVGQFAVKVFPEDCYAGEVSAAWSLNKPDLGVVSQSGKFQLYSAVGGPIEVQAFAGDFVATGIANVVVRIRDTTGVTAATANAFNGAGSGVDPMTVLYPYANTVFPLAIVPPVIQWDKGGSDATAVRVALRYPVTGTPTFLWEKITTESAKPRVLIPPAVWQAFEQTAKANTGAYVVQRMVGGTLLSEVVRPIRFATAPLRGQIIYTEYGRADFHAYMMTANPGSQAPAKNIFTTGGCPVCHSVSANGKMFATSNRGWGASGGLSKINSNGTFTELSDYPSGDQYKSGANDWRGFAWAPLTPNGEYALAANNVWGNSKQSVVGITNRAVSVPETLVSGGNGIGLKGEYYRTGNWTGQSGHEQIL